MSFFRTLRVSGTGLSAQRIRINVIASNMANTQTTKTIDGDGPYVKQNVVFEEVLDGRYRGGVRVKEIVADKKPPIIKHLPGHPDADEEGNVQFPNINPVEELVNLLEATRAYESNVTVLNSAKQLAQSAIAIGKR